MRRLFWAALLCSVCSVSGCGAEYAYVPTTNAVTTVHGNVAADYPIPPSAPQGDVRVASYGLTDVSPQKPGGEVLHALHLRVVLADNGAAAWTFDTRDQRVALESGEILAPAFASASAGTAPPLVAVSPNGKRVVDLFFVLPPGLQHAEAVPEFDALWRVQTGAGLVAERTPFERLAVEPDYGDYDDWDYGEDYYWNGPYWRNPLYPYGIPYGYVGGGAFIHRSPHFWHGGGGYRGGGFHGGGGGHAGGGGHGGGHR